MSSAFLVTFGVRLTSSLLAPACLVFASLVLLVACTADSADSFAASGKTLAAKGEYPAAILQFKSALQLAPRSAEVRFLLGKSLLAARDASGAAVELNKALDDGAPPVQVLPQLSKALVLTGDYRRLVSTYGELSLDDPAAQAELKTNVATAWGALSDRPKTEANLAAALKAQPDYPPAQLLRARVLAGQRKYEEATALVDAALAKDNRSYDAWLLRGELLYFGKGDSKAAEAAYRQAVAIDPSNVLAQAAIISALIRDRDVAGARKQADQLRAAAPKHPHTLLVDAQLAYLDGKHAQAREVLQRLLRLVPDHAGVLILAGAAEFHLGSVVQAAAHFGKALQLYPSLDAVRLNLAEVEIRLGQHAKALETLKPMLTASPPKVAALSLAGDAELRLGRAANAERFYQQAAQLAPNDERVQTAAALTRMWGGDATAALGELKTLSEKSAETYADEALFAAHLRRREFDAALKALEVMERKRPGRAVVQELRGRVHLARNDLPQARRGFEEARRIEPTLTAALVSLADIDVQEGQLDAAAQRLQAGIKAEPRNSALLLSLAELKARQDRPVAEVRSLFMEAVNAAPSSAEPRLRLLGFLLRKRLFNDALAASQETMAAMPADPLVLQAVGRAQMQAGDVEQAINTFRRLAAELPTSTQPQMLLAEVYGAAGKLPQVEAAIVKALEIDPNLAPAQSALVDLFVRSKRLRAASDYVARVKAQRPKEPVGYVLESAFYLRQNDREGAIKALREGLAKTDSSSIADRLFTLLAATGNTSEAERFGVSWLQKRPGDVGMEYLLSVNDISRGRLPTAEKRLQRVVAAMPNHAYALNNLAWVTLQVGGKTAAVHAQRAVDLQPDRVEFMDTLAQALAAENKLKPALELQQRAVALAPNNNEIRLTLAKLALQSGDKALARAELGRLKDLGAAFKSQNEVASLLGTL